MWRIKKRLRRLKCWFGQHAYQPVYDTRTWRETRGRKYLYKEFRLYCCRCNKPTKWYRLRRMDEIFEKLKVDWSSE